MQLGALQRAQSLADFLRDEAAREQAPAPAEFFAPLLRILKDSDCANDDVFAQLLVSLGNFVWLSLRRKC
jgi:hypothetical protein